VAQPTPIRQYKHDAFISYRRSDGSRHAERLRRRLLEYRIRPDLKGPEAPDVLNIYLDRIYETATEDFFRRTIQPALNDSGFLIVVQTPAALKPRSDGAKNWVVREIEYYRINPERPLAVALARGELSDRLPADLDVHFENIERVDIRRLTWPAPISSDENILPFIARLYNVPAENMPELRREELQRRSARVMTWSIAAGLLIIVLSGLLAWALMSQADARRSARDALEAAKKARIAADNAEERRKEADSERAEAQRQARFAQSRELASAALEKTGTDSELSLLLALRSLDATAPDHVVLPDSAGALRTILSSPPLLHVFSDLRAPVDGFAISPDGRNLVAGGSSGVMKMWDLRTFDASLVPQYSPGFAIPGYSPLGKYLFTRGFNGLRVWRVGDWRNSWSSDRVNNGPILFTADDSVLISVIGRDVVYVDPRTGISLGTILTASAPIQRIVLSPRNEMLITYTTADVSYWDLGPTHKAPRKREALLLDSVKDAVVPVAEFFTEDGSYHLTAYADGVCVMKAPEQSRAVLAPYEWSVDSLKNGTCDYFLKQPVNTSDITNIAVSPTHRLVAAAAADGVVRFWGLKAGRNEDVLKWPFHPGRLLGHLNAHVGKITQVAFLNDTTLVTGGVDGEIKLWNLIGNGLAFADLRPFGPLAQGIGFSPDSRFVGVTTSRMNDLWEIDSGSVAERTPVSYPVSFSADGRRTLIEQSIVVDWHTGRKLFELHHSKDDVAVWSAFSPDGNWIATLGYDQTVHIWNSANGAQVGKFRIDSKFYVARWSPNSEYLAIAKMGGTIAILRRDGGRVVRLLKGHLDNVYDIAFHPSNTRLASCSRDGVAMLWDLQTGRPLLRFDGAEDVRSVDFSPDGTELAMAGVDGTLRIVDPQSGNVTDMLAPGTTPLTSVRYSPDGRWLAVSSSTEPGEALSGRSVPLGVFGVRAKSDPDPEDFVKVYARRTPELVRLAKRRIKRPLSEAECRLFLHSSCKAQ
jgi:WD40 repeat protein